VEWSGVCWTGAVGISVDEGASVILSIEDFSLVLALCPEELLWFSLFFLSFAILDGRRSDAGQADSQFSASSPIQDTGLVEVA